MHLTLQDIARTLREARERKGLSQRALAARTGLPQSHVSKIENATVDLQTSSLIELARAVDLDVVLIPRSLLPAVQSLQRDSTKRTVQPAYRLEDEGDGDD